MPTLWQLADQGHPGSKFNRAQPHPRRSSHNSLPAHGHNTAHHHIVRYKFIWTYTNMNYGAQNCFEPRKVHNEDLRVEPNNSVIWDSDGEKYWQCSGLTTTVMWWEPAYLRALQKEKHSNSNIVWTCIQNVPAKHRPRTCIPAAAPSCQPQDSNASENIARRYWQCWFHIILQGNNSPVILSAWDLNFHQFLKKKSDNSESLSEVHCN